jgi:hypothetical protein
MPKFHNALRDWPTDTFTHTRKLEIEQLESGLLPLQQGVAQGGYVDDSLLAATVLNVSDDARAIHARVGIFFSEIVAGCSCGDEPMATHAYCELRFSIDKATAEADVTLMRN